MRIARAAVATLAAGAFAAAFTAACAVPPAPGPAAGKPALAAQGVRLTLAWTLRPDGGDRVLDLDESGAGTLRASREVEFETIEDPPVAVRAGPEFPARLAAHFDRLRTLPRFAHVSSSLAGVVVRLRAERGGEVVESRSFNTYLPPLADLVALLRASLGEPSASALGPLAGLERFRGAIPFAFTPGITPVGRLMEPLDPPSRDVELRILALDRIAELAAGSAGAGAARALAPRLHALYQDSVARGPEPDYFLARTLLRLGDAVGTGRVVEIAQSAHPEWGMEGAGLLAAAFGEAYGREPIPPYDFQSADDPRPAAAAEFLEWFAERSGRLEFDAAAHRFLLRAE